MGGEDCEQWVFVGDAVKHLGVVCVGLSLHLFCLPHPPFTVQLVQHCVGVSLELVEEVTPWDWGGIILPL